MQDVWKRCARRELVMSVLLQGVLGGNPKKYKKGTGPVTLIGRSCFILSPITANLGFPKTFRPRSGRVICIWRRDPGLQQVRTVPHLSTFTVSLREEPDSCVSCMFSAAVQPSLPFCTCELRDLS